MDYMAPRYIASFRQHYYTADIFMPRGVIRYVRAAPAMLIFADRRRLRFVSA